MPPGVATQASCRTRRRPRGRAPGRRADPGGVAPTGSTALTPGSKTTKQPPKTTFKAMTESRRVCVCCSVKPPQEGSRQRSCSAPNLRRSPRHSPAVPGVPSLQEMGEHWHPPESGWKQAVAGVAHTQQTKPPAGMSQTMTQPDSSLLMSHESARVELEARGPDPDRHVILRGPVRGLDHFLTCLKPCSHRISITLCLKSVFY